jgi:transcriptional regulator with XRE-family HTH domain
VNPHISTTHPQIGDTRPMAERLGQELRRLRLERGLSLRKMARALGMTAHSGLMDYERGSRIPSDGLLASYVKVLHVDDNLLLVLHQAARTEHARRRLTSTEEESLGIRCPRCTALNALTKALENMARLLCDCTEQSRHRQIRHTEW